jgi:hypothetical protein
MNGSLASELIYVDGVDFAQLELSQIMSFPVKKVKSPWRANLGAFLLASSPLLNTQWQHRRCQEVPAVEAGVGVGGLRAGEEGPGGQLHPWYSSTIAMSVYGVSLPSSLFSDVYPVP